MENMVRNSVLFVLCLRDATSAITLKNPEMCSTDSNAVLFSWRRTVSAWRMRAAIGDVLVRNLYIQATAGRLSHQIETLESRNVIGSTICSRTSQWRSIPVSSKSDIVSDPVLLADEQNWSRISWGHSKNHTMGTTSFVPLNHTPPTPHLDASTKP